MSIRLITLFLSVVIRCFSFCWYINSYDLYYFWSYRFYVYLLITLFGIFICSCRSWFFWSTMAPLCTFILFLYIICTYIVFLLLIVFPFVSRIYLFLIMNSTLPSLVLEYTPRVHSDLLELLSELIDVSFALLLLLSLYWKGNAESEDKLESM